MISPCTHFTCELCPYVVYSILKFQQFF